MQLIENLLASRAYGIVARVILTFVFWSSGLAKLIDFGGAVAEMERFGVTPAVPMAVAVIMVQLGGSALVISGRFVWLGAGALGVFTALTIPIAHAFWTMTGEMAFLEMMFVFEHVTVIGGLMVVAILSERYRAHTVVRSVA
ncbi:DoxX family protein [Rhizobium sp. BK251]|uniref:DoxX family protein n=1 Tax=Rhizobium sp. BK251 TaxID=2512125 RepID=UPI0010450588|nr:DoxX family protein [Rhizobium sp. BK251]TCL67165.1 transmembrane protein [Rhizobium sp. BK251]